MSPELDRAGQAIAGVLALELEQELELVASWVVWAVPVGWLPAEVADAAAELSRAGIFRLDRDRFPAPVREDVGGG